MSIVGYILIGCIAVVVGFFLYVMIETFYKLATSKIGKDEIERILAVRHREKERKRLRKAQKDLYYCPPTYLKIDIELTKKMSPNFSLLLIVTILKKATLKNWIPPALRCLIVGF